MTAVVNLADEVLDGVLQAAEHLKGSVVAAEAGPIESLRWAGALPLLLRDLRVQKIVSAEALLRCTTREQAHELLSVFFVEPAEGEEGAIVDKLVVLVSGFLWDYEPDLQRLLTMGVARQLTVCSSLSERAHECFDFEKAGGGAVPTGAKATKVMVFEDFASGLSKFNVQNQVKQTTSPRRTEPAAELSFADESTSGNGKGGAQDDWDWADDDEEREEPAAAAKLPSPLPVSASTQQSGVRVTHLPLTVAPLLSRKTIAAEPSLFVLSHPICASAFPLMLHQVQNLDGSLVQSSSTDESSSRANAAGDSGRPIYKHVKEVQPEHIPNKFRRSLRLLAHVIGDLVTSARLDVKERIYAMGSSSLKVGHTLLRILNELDEDAGGLHDRQPASMIIIDRTCDLAGPCSFGVSLLDRVLALLPQTTTDENLQSGFHNTMREHMHVTEIFPIHGCDPLPPVPPQQSTLEAYRASSFVSRIQWNGGASLAHPIGSGGEQVFRSLAFQPAKLALRELDKRLHEVENELIRHGRITKSSSVRRPGEKTRGRDVVQRRIGNILEAGEPAGAEMSSLVELGVIILETLERMERVQQQWDQCRDRSVRQGQLRKQGGPEWIVPELADLVQRRLSAFKSDPAGTNQQGIASLTELLTLLVHGFALSSQTTLEEFTVQMLSKVMSDVLLKAAATHPTSVQALFPDLFELLSMYINTKEASSEASSHNHSPGNEEWEWDEADESSIKPSHQSAPSTRDNTAVHLEAKSIAETFAATIIQLLQECGHEFAQLNDEEYSAANDADPRSIVAQLCAALLDPSRGSIPQLERIVDVSEQLTRAGIDLLKSGFSRFGFDVGGNSRSSSMGSTRLLGNSEVVVVFVVGGITFEEVQEVYNALEGTKVQVILGATTITNNELILRQLFNRQ